MKKETKLKLRTEHTRKELISVLIVAGALILLLGVFFAIKFFHKPVFTDLDTLHQQNYAGDLSPEDGEIYNGFSFVKQSKVWHTQVQKGTTLYEATFNFPPSEIITIPVSGALSESFLSAEKYYVTFDPNGNNLPNIGVANFGLSRTLSRAFGKDLQAGCTVASPECGAAPVITCDDENKSIFFFKEGEPTEIIFEENCVILQGTGTDIIKAKDRLLLRWYGIGE